MKIFKRAEEGQGLIEYALILVLIAVVVIVILSLLWEPLTNVFQNIVCDNLQLQVKLCQ